MTDCILQMYQRQTRPKFIAFGHNILNSDFGLKQEAKLAILHLILSFNILQSVSILYKER
jgi:hypothetical protein